MRTRRPIRAAKAKERRSTRGLDDYFVLPELLATTRRDEGLTQAQLAERLGLDQVGVAKIEAGVRRLDPVEMIAVLEAMEVDVAAFIERLRRHVKHGR